MSSSSTVLWRLCVLEDELQLVLMLQPILLVSPDTSRRKTRKRIISFSGVIDHWIYLGKNMIQKDNDFTRDMIRKRLGQGQDGINKYLVRILTLAIVEAASLVMDVSEKLSMIQFKFVRCELLMGHIRF
jgi:hypothetical protein